MRTLLQKVIDNPIATALLVLAALWGGGFALLQLPVGLFPGLDVPVVNVISHLPGAGAEELELLVTRPIEDRLRTIPGLRRVASTTIAGVSQVTAQFDRETSLAAARQLVQAQLGAARGALPAGVTPTLENIGTTLQEVVGYVVSGGADPVALRSAVQYQLASRLMGVEGVARVEVLGGDAPAFRVRVRPQALARHHLTLTAVANALKRFNRIEAAGYLDRGGRQYLIRGDSRLQSAADLAAVPVVSAGNRSVLLGDIATVSAGRAPRHYSVHGNGRPAVAFVVSKQPAASTLAVVRGVEAELAQVRSLLPAGSEIRKYYDQADLIGEVRSDLFHDLLLGALLAAAVLFFFLGTWRATLIVTATIPVALLATLGLMAVFGQSLNVITLSALTLAVGLVVDDAIVVAECVVRQLQLGDDRRAACLAGAAQIAGPDAAGTFTTVAAYAPLLFLGGLAGLFVRPFGLVVSLALLASLLVSLTLVPLAFSRFGVAGDRRPLGARLLAWLEEVLLRLLRFALAHRAPVLLAAVALLGLGGLGVFLGPAGVLPPIDEGALLIEYVMPPGTSLAESDRVGDLLEREALADKDVTTVYRRTGSPARGLQVEGVNRGELTIKLRPRGERKQSAKQVMATLRAEYQKLPGVVFLFHQPTQEKLDESLSGLPALFGVTLYGSDMDRLVALAGRVQALMAADPALGNIINNTRIKSPRLVVRPDTRALARLGLAPEDVFAALRAARLGDPATTIVRQRQEVQVLLQSGDAATLDALENLPVATPGGLLVPLKRLASIQIDHLPAALTRLDGQREVTLLAEVNGSIPAAVARLGKQFAALELPPGYSIAFTGQYQVLMETLRDFALIALAALLLIYLIMAMQFRSWLQPLVILVTVPVALVGALVLLVVTRAGLDVSVGMGVLTLVGIAVNNAIVLLDYANQELATGLSLPEALQSAASVRLRPIVMTATVTIFALLPVALDPAVGSRIFQPFAVAVIGGLLSATAATLVLVPVLRTLLPTAKQE